MLKRGDIINNHILSSQSDRPNILFAIADDASHMSAYGHRFVNTPNFDQVAAEGLLFLNAFTTNPKCSPSRASILAGMHTWKMEEACNHFGIFPSKFTVYPDLLEASGYHTGYTGKGWAPGDWKKGGCTRNPAGDEYNDIRLVPPENTCISDKDYAANFKIFLSKKPPGKPFCFWYGSHEPHRKYNEGEGIRAGKKIEDAVVPSYFPDDDNVKSDMLDYAYEIEWFDKHLGLMLECLEKTGELDNTLVIVTSDNGMPFPRVKGQMYEDDFHLPMCTCWKNVTKGGYRINDLISFIDIAPTILEAAGIEIPSWMDGKSLMDLIRSDKPDQANINRERVYMGRERHDVGREGDVGYPVRCVRTKDYLYIRNFKPDRWPAGNPETGFTCVDSSPTKTLILNLLEEGNDYFFNLSFGKRPEEELYHIIDDPRCMNNLAYEAGFEELKESLWKDLREKLEETGDPRISGQEHIFDTYEYTGYITHSWKAYVEGWFEKQIY